MMYREGLGVLVSDEKALEYLKIAADKGDDGSILNVGLSYTMKGGE